MAAVPPSTLVVGGKGEGLYKAATLTWLSAVISALTARPASACSSLRAPSASLPSSTSSLAACKATNHVRDMGAQVHVMQVLKCI